jgi:hypothetical protein
MQFKAFCAKLKKSQNDKDLVEENENENGNGNVYNIHFLQRLM